MTRNLASELAVRGIRVNQVTPGGTKTPIWSPQASTEQAKSMLEQRIGGTTALGRMGEAEEIAKAALYLASDDASAWRAHLPRYFGGSCQVCLRYAQR
jgi:NAD(P)-dependent dehydrogenase (short-subunit alcohol dehydrogenase family)